MTGGSKLTAAAVTDAAREYDRGQRASIRALAAARGVTFRAMREQLLRRGVVLRSRGGSRHEPPSPQLVRAVVHLYVAHQLSTTVVGELVGRDDTTIGRWLEHQGVRRRGRFRWNASAATCRCDLPERVGGLT